MEEAKNLSIAQQFAIATEHNEVICESYRNLDKYREQSVTTFCQYSNFKMQGFLRKKPNEK